MSQENAYILRVGSGIQYNIPGLTFVGLLVKFWMPVKHKISLTYLWNSKIHASAVKKIIMSFIRLQLVSIRSKMSPCTYVKRIIYVIICTCVPINQYTYHFMAFKFSTKTSRPVYKYYYPNGFSFLEVIRGRD